MSEWKTAKLGSLCETIFSGGTPSTSEPSYWDGGLLWLSSGETQSRYIYTTDRNITPDGVNNSSTRLAYKHDVVIACAGQGNTRGQSSVVFNDMYINQSVIAMRTKPSKLDYRYLFYNLTLRYNELRAISDASSTRGSITTEMLKKLTISTPPLPTQTHIANILSAYDDAIENNKRRIALLENAARKLYREWFVRMRFPGHEDARFVNGLPEGWEVEPLGEMVNITSSKRSYESKRVDVGIPLYRSKEIIQIESGEEITESLYISEEWFTAIKDKFGAPQENDILVTSRGTIGMPFLVDKRIFYFSDGNLTWLQSGKHPETALYLYLWLNSTAGQGAVQSVSIGTSQKALPIESLKRLRLVKPSDTVITAFYEKTMPLIDQKRNLRKQSQNLAKQRDLLLPRLMSGKLEV